MTASAPASIHASTPHRRHAWLLDFVLLAAIWGSSFMFMRLGAVELGPFATAGLRVAIAAAFLVPWLLLRGQGGLLREHLPKTLLVGVINSAIPFVCFSYALLSISTGLSSILNATVPLFGAIVAWVWLGDRPTRSRTLGLLIGFAGVALLTYKKSNFVPSTQGVASGWAVLACLLACFCYGGAASFTRRYMAGLPSMVSATGSQIGATMALLPFAWLYWPAHAVSAKAWVAVVALGVVCTALAYVLYFRLIERAGPARALSVTFAITVFALFYGVVLLGESITPWMVGCGLVIVAGTCLSTGLVQLPRR